jgi:hypothetical protein
MTFESLLNDLMDEAHQRGLTVHNLYFNPSDPFR